MRITDIALSTPVVGARPAPAKRAGEGSSPALVRADPAHAAEHPDSVAEAQLARAAGRAAAVRVVASQNHAASDSVRGHALDLTRVP